MAESDRISRYLTGRQSAHLKLMSRKQQRVDGATGKPKPAPDVSVISWEVHEEICEPYRIKTMISTREPVGRKQVLGQFVEFSIQPEDGRELRQFHGFVSRFDLVSESRDGCIYRVVVRQRLAMLDGPSNCVTYQQMASWEIIKTILERHDIRFWMQVELRLRREHPKHDFRFQYNMGDWAYIKLEMEQAGLFCFTTTGEFGEVLVIADDIDGYERPYVTVPDRPTAGLSTFEESIFSFRVRTCTVPESFVVADYNPDNAWEVLRDESDPAYDDPTMIGKPYVWGTHHEDAEGAKREAQLRLEAAQAQQVRYKVKSTVLELRPGRVVRSDRQLEDTQRGMFVTKVVHSGARDASYMNRFTAIPAERPYRMAIDESRWPRIHGTLGATICSPDKYKFAYITARGEYVARFHCDFGNWPKGAESVPLRLAKPFSGKNNTGMHMPALDGDEALVGFREGNPNKPILVGFVPNSQRPDLINSSRRRMSRNEIRTQSGNKLWMDDWDNQEGIELSTEHSGRSQLNLGFIPDRELKERGAGAELRTSGHAVARGGAGAMLTAYNQTGSSGRMLAMNETDAQFTDHQVLARSLADSAAASKASPADLDAQQAIHDGLKELKKPGVLVTGPGPVGVASGDGVHLAADGSIIGTAKKGVHFSTLRRITAAAGDVLSMFAQKGMSLITSAGDFVAQAQRGRMQLAAQEDVSIESVNGVVHVKAAKEIILNVDGSYVKINGGGVEIGSRGGVLYRTAGVKGTGPAQMNLAGAAFAPAFVPYTTACEVWRTNPAFVPSSAPAPEPNPSQGESLGNSGAMSPAPSPVGAVAPSPFSDLFSRKSADALPPGSSAHSPFDGKPSNVDSEVPKAKVTLNRPEDQQAVVAPDPIKLVNAVPCDWKISDLKSEVKQHIEAKSYWGMLNNRTPWMSDDGKTQYRGGGSRDSYFEFAYSEKDKAITCTVRAMIIPMDLYPVDLKGARDTSVSTDEATIPYEYSTHSTMAPGSIVNGVRMDYRDAVGPEFDVKALISRIEAVLNQGGYKLILDSCSKGAACGCRVKVNFRVDLRVSPKGIPIAGFKPHVTLKLFPLVLRADTGSWGEKHKYKVKRRMFDYPDANVEAHECGHYFNFPDEYYDQGGWLHESYIKNEQIDFSLIDTKAGAMVWQGHSQTDATMVGANVMGDGANAALQNGRVTAAIKPYYLEYVRRQFSLATNKLWRVGYES
ncbi:type VI secretion system Vgr family protein [Paraburkholderia antibiotica]|uniref:Type VI secretion system tip protein VgrG n=1 Tax=Paraburkholderia antibiotica TaxID=2728839 RepID=A0A7X9ZWY8_9BURK|nr:type VI secretion system Vgr family protein [Paraburkholderia antibiotica]NML30085.1 type VI secretion system tip protein VgrG [Paraburkholderia antibiotica]